MPLGPQDAVTLGTGLAVAALLLFALWRACGSRRDDRWLILLLAGGVAVRLEPFACFMVKAHHPAIGAYVLLRGLDVTVPLQLLFFYILYFAPTGAYIISRAERDVSLRGYVLDLFVIFLLLFGGEAIAIHLGIWFFFDNNPFAVLGLPLWVALTNIAALYAWSLAILYCVTALSGPARYLAVVAGPFLVIAVYAPVSLPTAIALYPEGIGYDRTIPAAVISSILALSVIFGTRHIMKRLPGSDRCLPASAVPNIDGENAES